MVRHAQVKDFGAKMIPFWEIIQKIQIVSGAYGCKKHLKISLKIF